MSMNAKSIVEAVKLRMTPATSLTEANGTPLTVAAQAVIKLQSKDDPKFWDSESTAMSPGLRKLKNALDTGNDKEIKAAAVDLAKEVYSEGNFDDPTSFVAEVMKAEPVLGKLFKLVFADFSRSQMKKIEAYGVKGMKSTPWRKIFKSHIHLHKWADKNQAEVHGTRDAEDGME